MGQPSSKIADALMKSQNLSTFEASQIAAKISDDSEIAEAALRWAQTGAYEEWPEVAGHTPLELSAKYRPSQVFTILLGLRRDPEHAERMLRSFGSDAQQHII